MRILHIIAQKPHSTGSGVYLTGMVEGFAAMGYPQALIAGLNLGESLPEKERSIIEGAEFYPLFYRTEEMNFPVLGMSDVMPYESTRYRDLDRERLKRFQKAFAAVVSEAVEKFRPDLVLSHHLYLSTALLRDLIPKEIPLAGICHETCLRQLQNNPLEREWIRSRIARLDLLMALHEEQKKRIVEIFGADPEKVVVIGSGYDSRIFYDRKQPKSSGVTEIVYTGKMSRSKGVLSLISALQRLSERPQDFGLREKPSLRLRLIGGGNNSERLEIEAKAKTCLFPVEPLGRLETQEEIACLYAESDIFVLASFFEGLPLVISEAMACGLEVVTTAIPGVQEWIESLLGQEHSMVFVPLPKMETIDRPFESELGDFERRLAEAVASKILLFERGGRSSCQKVERLSWRGLCQRILEIIGTLFQQDGI